MTNSEFIDMLQKTNIVEDKVNEIARVYNIEVPETLGKLLSIELPCFFEGGRVMSVQEILNASQVYDVDFIGEGIIPCIDCFDNDFVVFEIVEMLWTKYNIVDQYIFGDESKELIAVLGNIGN